MATVFLWALGFLPSGILRKMTSSCCNTYCSAVREFYHAGIPSSIPTGLGSILSLRPLGITTQETFYARTPVNNLEVPLF